MPEQKQEIIDAGLKPYDKEEAEIYKIRGLKYDGNPFGNTDFTKNDLDIATNLYDVTINGAANDDYSDNIIISTNNVVTIIKDQMTPDKDYRWSTAFPLIRQANLIIENVGKSDFPDNIKKEMIAEGKMLRAMIYFNKARLFGKFVLIDKVLTPEDELQLGRSKTIKETYDFILKDLKDAASGLPENAENGYFTKGAALALKAEVALHGASYIETGKESDRQ